MIAQAPCTRRYALQHDLPPGARDRSRWMNRFPRDRVPHSPSLREPGLHAGPGQVRTGARSFQMRLDSPWIVWIPSSSVGSPLVSTAIT